MKNPANRVTELAGSQVHKREFMNDFFVVTGSRFAHVQVRLPLLVAMSHQANQKKF